MKNIAIWIIILGLAFFGKYTADRLDNVTDYKSLLDSQAKEAINKLVAKERKATFLDSKIRFEFEYKIENKFMIATGYFDENNKIKIDSMKPKNIQ